MAHRIFLLQEILQRIGKIIEEAENRLKEIELQLSVLQRQCTYRDRPLCDTLKLTKLDESGTKDVIKKVKTAKPLFVRQTTFTYFQLFIFS